MKPILLIFSTLILFSCGTRKVDLQREINTYKTELSAQKKKNSQTDSIIENVQKMFNAVIEQNYQSRQEWAKQMQELAESYRNESSELAEDVQISGAVGTVKLTDSKGNLYEIPSTSGTTINKNSNAKTQQENKEIRQAFIDERKSNEVLQQDITRLSSINQNLKNQLTKKDEEISDLKEKTSAKTSTKSKQTERKAYPWWLLVAAGFFLNILVKFFWGKVKQGNWYFKLIETLNRKR